MTAIVFNDRVRETSTTTGTGTITTAGAVLGYRTFLSGIGTGNTTAYCITNVSAGLWEVGLGVVTAGFLTRATVLTSSNSNNLVSFTGNLDVFGTIPASLLYIKDTSGTVPAYTRTTLTSTLAEVTYTVPYTPGSITVYINGVLLSPTDYTATDGTTINLVTHTNIGDVLDVISFVLTTVPGGISFGKSIASSLIFGR